MSKAKTADHIAGAGNMVFAAYQQGVRFAERRHGIGPAPLQGKEAGV